MLKLTPMLALAMILPVPAFAQATTTADANSTSGANSQVILEGSEYARHAPGLGGIGSNSTAPCVVGYGGGLVIPGGGAQLSNGRVDKDCVVRTEAAMLRDLLDMQNTPGKRAAIVHACANTDRLAETLTAMGECPRRVEAAGRTSATIQYRETVRCPTGSTFDGRGCWKGRR